MKKRRILKLDSGLAPYCDALERRVDSFKKKRRELVGTRGSLVDFANGHHYFGFHYEGELFVYREWAPSAEALYLTGEFNDWNARSHPLTRLGNGVFELKLPLSVAPRKGQRIQTVLIHEGRELRRIPLYATRVVQDKGTFAWFAEIEDVCGSYPFTDTDFKMPDTLFIYECHIGMATERGEVGSYREFAEQVLPRIRASGYTAIQIMAIMEHPYYASFGYQVTNFFAASSRYGRSEDLKALINDAHAMGIAVLLDVVHSHTASNTAEGICEFDGTPYQFCHEGARGMHDAWGTRLFDYGKNEVIHFLLSDLKYWMEVFHFDGFRFDGVTSMLYRDHGLGSKFSHYDAYFGENVDEDAVVYLQLANALVHQLDPAAITIAEDVSGMPGTCLPIRDGGIGFDYRLSMAAPDLWVKLVRDVRDEDWNIGWIWHELTSRRKGEKRVGYCESHDQALVGDKTLMFRLCDAEMYTHMSKRTPSEIIDRGMALHKMIRLATATLAGEGYLNFMGNEFGHPEWIDFPREGNGWSYHYCRRQWSLADREALRYGELLAFDREMLGLLKRARLLKLAAKRMLIHEEDKVLIYRKGEYLFVFNFHPTRSFPCYFIPTGERGAYAAIFSTEEERFGGSARAAIGHCYQTRRGRRKKAGFDCYLPSRSAIVFKKEAVK